MSEVDSVEFDAMTKSLIRTFYNNHCTFCLSKLSVEGSQCTYILDPSEEGARQVAMCSWLGIIPHNYARQSQDNGIILCASCHVLFTNDYIALCPPKELLDYLVKYVEDTPARNQLPLYQVFSQLAVPDPQLEGLPYPSTILPYIGLYTIVHLKPAELQDMPRCTPFLPSPSILHNGQWENAHTQTASTTPNVACVFDSLTINISDQCPSAGLIPLHPDHPHYSDKRYWRLSMTTLGGILSAVMWRAILTSSSTADDELRMVRGLYGLLTLRKLGVVDVKLSSNAVPSGDGCRKVEGGGGSRGGKGQRGTAQKRAAEEERNTHNTRSSSKRHLKRHHF